MEETVDLRMLGEMLRQRRKALDLTREEVATRAGVTPAYLYLIEHARPRSGGTPSRPKREFLRRWAEVLGMDERATDELLRLGGYAPVDSTEASAARRTASEPAAPLYDMAGPATGMPPSMSRVRAAHQPRAAVGPGQETENDREMLIARLEAVLDRAERSQTVWRDTVHAIDVLLTYLVRRLDEGDDGT